MTSPRLDRRLDDPWLTRRMRATATVTRTELAIRDVILAAYAQALDALWQVALDEPGTLTAAGAPNIDAAIETARSRWRTAIAEVLHPVLESVLGEQWRRVYHAVMRRVPDPEQARWARLATAPNHLRDDYWRAVADRLGRSINDIFDTVRAELLDGQARGESVAQLRDRIARVLQLDSGTREIRSEIRSVESRMLDPDLTDTERDELLEQHTRALRRAFLVDARAALARAFLRVAEALERFARIVTGEEREQAVRDAEWMRERAEETNPTREQRDEARERLADVERRLYTHDPEAFRERRRQLYEELRAREHGWRAKATRVARTETMSSLNGGTVDAARALAEATGVELTKTWLATSDHRTRETHWVADGMKVPITAPFVVGGFPLMFPGDPAAPPGERLNCRCTVLLEDDEDERLYQSLAAAATVNDQEVPTMSELPNGWRGVLAPLDTKSGDGRVIATPQAGLRHRQPPLPILWQPQLSAGHDTAVVVGRIDRVWIEGGRLMGEGPFDLESDHGQEAARQLAAGMANGISVDLDDAVFEVRLVDRDGNQIPEPGDEEEVMQLLQRMQAGEVSELAIASEWRLMGATIVAHPAFDEARIEPVEGYAPAANALSATSQPLVAAGTAAERSSSGTPTRSDATNAVSSTTSVDSVNGAESTALERRRVSLTAAGVLAPPERWFDDPQLSEPSPIRIGDEGRIFGHLACWRTCHSSWEDVCVVPPRSHTGYALFHTGEVVTAEGSLLPVGKITLGGGHADVKAGHRAAAEHYDDVGTCVAVVRAGEDAHGIWVAGALVPGTSDEQIAALRRSPLSGDWRRVGGNLELVAALAVNTPGFPIPRAVAASGAQVSLVAAGVVPPARRDTDVEERIAANVLARVRADMRSAERVKQLAASIGRDPKTRVDDIARSLGLDQ